MDRRYEFKELLKAIHQKKADLTMLEFYENRGAVALPDLRRLIHEDIRELEKRVEELNKSGVV